MQKMKITHLALIIVTLSIAALAQDLPKPEIRLVGISEHVSNGVDWKMYEIEVVNRDQFENDLFIPAPVLPPCGKNENSSRTWINAYRDGRRFYGWCGIAANIELASLKFSIPALDTQPKKIIIEFIDRAEGKIIRSNTIKIE